jgi:mono/diheme cytochrome c family protein
VQFLAVHVGDGTLVEVAAQAVEHGVEFPFVKDIDGRCVAALGVERTPEVAVLDAGRALRYRGRIDDQYRPGGNRPAPARHDLKEALDAVLAGKEVAVPTTTVDGCRITDRRIAADAAPVTFADHVGPLLHKHCAGCHRPNGAAPFSLVTYEQARGRAKAVAEVVADGRMPPWYAAPGHGDFANRRGLAPEDRDAIARWARGGMARGDESKLPPAPAANDRADGWQIGEPDLVLSTDAFDLPADGDVPYKYVILPHVFLNETWVQGVQILPDNPKVVHHCNLAYASLGRGFDESNFVTGLVPGNGPMRLADGVAYRIPPASALGLQIHFVTTGKPEKCRLRVGVRYASGAVKKQLRFVLFDGRRFTIPPHAPAHPVRAAKELEHDAVGIGFFSHMHLRGKAMTFTARRPGGEAETLLMIPNFSFDWQLPYVLREGELKLPKGTRMECVALYDNSAFNPFNPDPAVTVRSGLQTYHEMMNGFFFYVAADEDLKLDIDPKTGRPGAGR